MKNKNLTGDAFQKIYGRSIEELSDEKEKFAQIPLMDILDYHTNGPQPFEVEDDEDMKELITSVELAGILEPVIVRKDIRCPGKYEMISGHRRKYVAKQLGHTTIPAVIRDLDDDAAEKLMVASNMMKRKHIKPSVKARAYRRYLEAERRQAGRPKKNSGPRDQNLTTSESIADRLSVGEKTIRRYARLTELVPELMNLLDNDNMPVKVGEQISYIRQEGQKVLYEFYEETKTMPTIEQAKALKEISKEQELTKEILEEYFGITHKAKEGMIAEPKQRERIQKIRFSEKAIRKYFPLEMQSCTDEEKLEYTVKALVFYNKYNAEHGIEK